jgi:hypothetical protein
MRDGLLPVASSSAWIVVRAESLRGQETTTGSSVAGTVSVMS